MVLTTTSLEELADKIAEVAVPTIAATSIPPGPSPQLLEELQQLRTEVIQLQSFVRSLSLQSRRCSTFRNWQSSPAPHSATRLCVGTTKKIMVKQLRNACRSQSTLNRQMTWPAVNGNRCIRPSNLSPIAHHWPHKQTYLSRRYWCTSVVPPYSHWPSQETGRFHPLCSQWDSNSNIRHTLTNAQPWFT